MPRPVLLSLLLSWYTYWLLSVVQRVPAQLVLLFSMPLLFFAAVGIPSQI
jgi:hypothetical protein